MSKGKKFFPYTSLKNNTNKTTKQEGANEHQARFLISRAEGREEEGEKSEILLLYIILLLLLLLLLITSYNFFIY
jgi:hypothetical protein